VAIVAVLLIAPALILFAVVLFVSIEIVAGVLARSTNQRIGRSASALSRPSIAVIVPAHNESSGILPTLADLRAQLRHSDRLIVVADNCSDDTAAVAASAGAEVVLRDDLTRVGKGYALARGLDHLRPRPPEIVVMVDADCRVANEAIDRLAATCSATGRPAQALYLMVAAKGSPPGLRVAAFAWRVKNWVRPQGLMALGLPCQLTGSGMAFPWHLIRSVDLASAQIVEDLKLGLDLARAGSAPVFCSAATITSEFPTSTVGIQTQRLRWEHGHMAMLVRYVPRLIITSIADANINLFCLALDLAVPPISLLIVMILSIIFLGLASSLIGVSWLPLAIGIASLLIFALSIFVSWYKFGREVITYSDLLQLPRYMLGKTPIYREILIRKSPLNWVRTDRTTD
jgi:cellulose synthase/poly-beta-1,6-N-acetylglucosamine synthase-like glycosyltransferase